jgi:hypothetical protein
VIRETKEGAKVRVRSVGGALSRRGESIGGSRASIKGELQGVLWGNLATKEQIGPKARET